MSNSTRTLFAMLGLATLAICMFLGDVFIEWMRSAFGNLGFFTGGILFGSIGGFLGIIGTGFLLAALTKEELHSSKKIQSLSVWGFWISVVTLLMMLISITNEIYVGWWNSGPARNLVFLLLTGFWLLKGEDPAPVTTATQVLTQSSESKLTQEDFRSNCTSCGGEVTFKASAVQATCPFCGKTQTRQID